MDDLGPINFPHDDQISDDEKYYLNNLALRQPRFTCYPVNTDLDIPTKRAALKVSSSVVALQSFSGGKPLTQGCGTVIEAEGNTNYVITSASLVRRPTKNQLAENKLADNLEVFVHTSEETTHIGEIYTCDLHYNLLVIVFQSHSSIEAVKLRPIDLNENVFEKKSFQLRPHSVKVKHGDSVIVVGRYFYKPFVYMAAPGTFSVKHCPLYECKEILQASCYITRCGDGSALLNLSGEMIGIAFYDAGDFPILPINIVCKWWAHYKIYKELRHPSYGFDACNLGHSAGVATLERVMKKFPSICGGVVVEEVPQGSYAELAGLSEDDIIVKCEGKTVESFLELWEVMFDKVGESVELEVIRLDVCSILSLRMKVTEATPDELNNWPQWEDHSTYSLFRI